MECVGRIIALCLLLAACTSISRETLLPGIAEHRARDDVDITVHVVTSPWLECLKIVGPVNAFFSVILLSPYRACALVARDQDLEPGDRPWCHVWVPKDSPALLEHELLHCEGYGHE